MPPDFARYRVEPDEDIVLADQDPAAAAGYDAEEARDELASLTDRIADLQARLYAEERQSLLVVLQGIDAAGKDSTVAHVFRGVNPQGCRVYTYKEPTPDESAHDFLWRYHRDTPARGTIHVFNRSHY
jgi:polyphosphate kinase 2 (PPK2 family)